MKHVLVVCLMLATITAAAQSQARTPPLRKGVHVQMPVTRTAVQVPEADNEDAWVVTVAADGTLYFGADAMRLDQLAEWIKTHPRNRDAMLYIKADARTVFANVEKVLQLARATGFETPILLTAQNEHTEPGTMTPPEGVDILVGSALPSGMITTGVQLLPSGQEPHLLINGDQISGADVESTLRKHFQNGDDKTVLLRADATLPFAEVVHAIDSCRAAGAKVYLAESGQ